MGMLSTRRQGRIARRFLQCRNFCLHRSQPRQQNPNDRLRLRWLPGNHFLGNQYVRRHKEHVADFAICAKPNFTPRLLQGVNGYASRRR